MTSCSKSNELTLIEICRLNDLSLDRAEKALATLQQKGLVSGFIPGDVQAQITLTADATTYFN